MKKLEARKVIDIPIPSKQWVLIMKLWDTGEWGGAILAQPNLLVRQWLIAIYNRDEVAQIQKLLKKLNGKRKPRMI